MPTILVVEGDRSNLHLFTEFFKLLGYVVQSTARGNEAVRMAQDHHPALILMNLHLPGGLNGLEAACEIKAQPDLQSIPIVIMSADYENGIEQKILDAKCEGYIQKPVEMANLRALVHALAGES